MKTRRDVLFLLGGIAIAPRAALAQPKPAQGKVWRIGFIYMSSRQNGLESGRYTAFLQGMRDFGYVEGTNYVLEARFADGNYKLLPGMVAEILSSKVDIIVSTGTPVSLVLQQTTRVVPVVVTTSNDPVREGLAASLARPGGNFTGFANVISDLFAKQVELLMTAVPKLPSLAVLSNPANSGHPGMLESIEAAAKKFGVRVHREPAATPEEIERAFRGIARARAQAVIVLGDLFFVQQFRQIARLAIQHRLPSTYTDPAYADAGGFMTYGPSFTDNYRNVARFVDKILKGAKAGDLPFEEPTKLYLVINRKTAKAIGLPIRQELILRADKVIE